MSYGNHCGRDMHFWRLFIRQCSVKQLVRIHLRLLIITNGNYSVYGAILPTDKGQESVIKEVPVMLPRLIGPDEFIMKDKDISVMNGLSLNAESQPTKQNRNGKGCHILPIIRSLLTQEECKIIESKQDYKYLGVYDHPGHQTLYFIPNIQELEQTADNDHFLWDDIQFSKGSLNKDRMIQTVIKNQNETVFYRTAPCNGVKMCTISGCTYVAPIREKRPCPHHKISLVKTDSCPVEFVYVYPADRQDKRRWIGGIVRHQKDLSKNLHNHVPPSETKIAQCVEEKINIAIPSNPTLTASDISLGKGLGFVPCAVDVASSHLGRVSKVVAIAKQGNGFSCQEWFPSGFESTADELDKQDEKLRGDFRNNSNIYNRYGRPYLMAAGVEDGIKFIFTMSPLMSRVAAGTEFMQCDITYDEFREYSYILNAVVFNDVLMEWMVIGRVRLDKQDKNAYSLAFRKIFQKCQEINLKYLEFLLGLVVDWSDAQIKGLKRQRNY